MGTKHSSYGTTFVMQKELEEDKRGPIHGVFIDSEQFPSSGIIGVSNTSTI